MEGVTNVKYRLSVAIDRRARPKASPSMTSFPPPLKKINKQKKTNKRKITENEKERKREREGKRRQKRKKKARRKRKRRKKSTSTARRWRIRFFRFLFFLK